MAVRGVREIGVLILLALSSTTEAGETHFVYDSLGRVRSVVYSDGSSTTYQYDKAGNRIQVVRVASTGVVNPNNNNPFCYSSDLLLFWGDSQFVLAPALFGFNDPDGDAVRFTAATAGWINTSGHLVLDNLPTYQNYSFSFDFTVGDGRGGFCSGTILARSDNG